MNAFRNMTVIIIIILVLIVSGFVYVDGTFMGKKYISVWDQEVVENLSLDLEKILSGALTAASSHNMQPWLVDIVNETEIILYANIDKELPVIDSNQRQFLMSQGTFIENFEYMHINMVMR